MQDNRVEKFCELELGKDFTNSMKKHSSKQQQQQQKETWISLKLKLFSFKHSIRKYIKRKTKMGRRFLRRHMSCYLSIAVTKHMTKTASRAQELLGIMVSKGQSL